MVVLAMQAMEPGGVQAYNNAILSSVDPSPTMSYADCSHSPLRALAPTHV